MSHSKLKIHSIETLGTHEGPGIRFVLFLQGCNYRCLYCHNPDTQSINGGKEVQSDELIKKIVRDEPYFGHKGGVTVSGGEPLIQAAALADLFRRLKRLGINTALDTNGSLLNRDTKKLLDYTDLVLLDIKHVDQKWHKKITGQENGGPLSFLEYLSSINKKTWIRYVLVPGYTDQEKYLKEAALKLKKYDNIERIEILPYHTLGVNKYKGLNLDYKLPEVKIPSQKEIELAKDSLEISGKKIFVR
jgi:pyruvate formate lyase activating enzyme